MKSPALQLFSAAVCFVFGSLAHAQLVTYQTVSDYSGSSQYSLPAGKKAGQTFSNILAISSLTYNFFNSGSSSATSLTATFAKWNGTGGFTGFTQASRYTTIQDFGTFTVPAFTGVNQNGWTSLTNTHGTYNTFQQTFNFGSLYLTDPDSIYALLLSNESASTTSIGIGFSADSFEFGDAAVGLGSLTQDYTFAQIVVIPNDGEHSIPITPVPETSTVVLLSCAALVGLLVAVRLRQRRQLAPVLTRAC